MHLVHVINLLHISIMFLTSSVCFTLSASCYKPHSVFLCNVIVVESHMLYCVINLLHSNVCLEVFLSCLSHCLHRGSVI